MDHGQSHSRPFKREIAALVTDQGGQLCHAAILASEYGLPCVVGTVDATRLVHPKNLLRVDGNQGAIYKVR